MVIGSSPLRAIRDFTRLLTSRSREVSRCAHKLARISTGYQKERKRERERITAICLV